MNFPACPDAFTAVFPSGCYNTTPSPASPPPALIAPDSVTWHMVPLSPTATGLVLILLTVLLTTLLVSKTEK